MLSFIIHNIYNNFNIFLKKEDIALNKIFFIKDFYMAEVSTHNSIPAPNADAICLYHTAELCISHAGSLMPYGNANEIVKKMCLDIKLQNFSKPVFAGVCGTDPTLLMENYLIFLKTHGITGIQNFPSVGIADQIFRCNLEAVRFAYRQEIEMLRCARELGLDIFPFVYSLSDAMLLSQIKPKKIIFDLGFSVSSQYADRIKAVKSLLNRTSPTTQLYLYVRNRTVKKKVQQDLSLLRLLHGFYHSNPLHKGAEPHDI